MRRIVLVLLPLVLLAAPDAMAGDAPSPKDVHRAVQDGAEWLKGQFKEGFEGETWRSTPEIVALTFVHAQVSQKDKVFAKCIETIESTKLQFTYRVAVLAMALSRMNPYKYRAKLAHCAQWLVDTQLPGGEWGYPGAVVGRTDASRAIKVKAPVLPDEEGIHPSKRKPLVIVRQKDPASFGEAKGDISNTQFALLALRACKDARIVIPKATWKAALDYTIKYQQEDGSFGYVVGGEQDAMGYASLTCAGIAGIAICLNNLKKNAKSHPAVKKGLKWLNENWDPAQNFNVENSAIIPPSTWQCYHLYSLERVGRLLNLKKVGKKKWYDVGAKWLLAHQKGDGHWEDPGGDTSGRNPPYLRIADTCFAILFLTLATPPLTR